MANKEAPKKRVYQIALGDSSHTADVRMIHAKGFADAYAEAKRVQKVMNFREVVRVEYIAEIEN